MASIVSFVPRDMDFDPETLKLAGAAFDKARLVLDALKRRDVAPAVAKQIITLACGGERDADRLCDKALVVFGLQRPRSAA